MKDPYKKAKLGDYFICCDICGNRCYASTASILDVYTGRGGCIVCPECKDPIDYGIVPYKVPAEKPVPVTRDTMSTGNNNGFTTPYPPFNYEVWPVTTSPDVAATIPQSSGDLAAGGDTGYTPKNEDTD